LLIHGILNSVTRFKDSVDMRAVKKHGGARPGSGPRPRPPTKVVRLPVPIADFARKLAAARKPGDVAAVFDVESRTVRRVPMMAWPAACGFPSPAEDYVDRPLDFNELLIEHPAATFAIRIEGDSMTGAGIFPGDIAVVDRAREPVNGSIILALLDGAFTVKRYRIKDGAVWLQAENPAFADMQLTDGQSFEVWGVITRSIRML
jgi:SOS-response transcriptional repressor LexA